MPILKSHGDTYRRYFELAYGLSVRHDQWLKYKRELQSAGLAINKENVETYAKIKRLRPRCIITKTSIEKLETFSKKYSSSRPSFRGCEIKDLVSQLSPWIKEDTFYKNFNRATNRNFKSSEKYSYEETGRVITFCSVVLLPQK